MKGSTQDTTEQPKTRIVSVSARVDIDPQLFPDKDTKTNATQ